MLKKVTRLEINCCLAVVRYPSVLSDIIKKNAKEAMQGAISNNLGRKKGNGLRKEMGMI